MTQDTVRCSSCGQSATGKFCNNCGSPLTGATCRSCGTELSLGARFCHLCGAPQGRQRGAPEGAMLARIGWGVAAIAVATLFIVLALRLPGAGSSTAAPSTAAGPPPFANRPAPDISNMTPRERADSLFNRIMREYEAGNQSRVDFFRPMALQAYGLLGQLDPDARYHVGLIHTITGDLASARAQVDSIQSANSNHLMGFMLQAAAARLDNDQAALTEAYRGFLQAYNEETAASRQEYSEHGSALEAFRAEAARETGAGNGGG